MYPLSRSMNGCYIMGGWGTTEGLACSLAAHCSLSSNLWRWSKLLLLLKVRTKLLMSLHRRSRLRLGSAWTMFYTNLRDRGLPYT
jgi:hypothetical protein